MAEYVARERDIFQSYGQRNGYLRANLHLYASRRKPVYSGYRSSWDWGERTGAGLIILRDAPLVVEERDRVDPGDRALVMLYPLHPEHWVDISVGFEMELREGSTLIGRASIVERVPPASNGA